MNAAPDYICPSADPGVHASDSTAGLASAMAPIPFHDCGFSLKRDRRREAEQIAFGNLHGRSSGVEKDYLDWIKRHFDLNLSQDHSPKLGRKSTAQIETHLNAEPGDWKNRQSRIRQSQIRRYRRQPMWSSGQPLASDAPVPEDFTLNHDLHCFSRWDPVFPSLVVRIDCDAHGSGGGVDRVLLKEGQRAVAFLREQLGNRLYVERSPRGWSGYTAIALPRSKDRRRSKLTANLMVQRVGQAVRAIVLAAGFYAGRSIYEIPIEVLGGFVSTRRACERECVNHPLPSLVRAPRCPTDSDVRELLAAHCLWWEVGAIVASAAQIQLPTHLRTEPNPVDVPRTGTSGRLERQEHKRTLVRDFHDVFTNSLQVCSKALIEAVNRSAGSVHRVDEDQVLERANELYEHHRLARHDRDRDRDDRFRGIIRYMLVNWDAGKGTTKNAVRFGFEDIYRADQLCRSTIPYAWIEKANEHLRSKKRGGLIRYVDVAWALCTIAKNAAISEGACPVSAIEGMFRYHRMPFTTGMVTECIHLLKRAGLVSSSKWWRGRCRRFRISSLVQRHLPFLRNVQSLPLIPQKAPQTSSMMERFERSTVRIGGGQLKTSTTTPFFLPPNCTSAEAIRGTDAHDGTCQYSAASQAPLTTPIAIPRDAFLFLSAGTARAPRLRGESQRCRRRESWYVRYHAGM